MNCTSCQNELEDFLYGELDTARANAVRAHLRECEGCAQMQAALEREQEVFAQYYEQAAAEPSSEMWQAIQLRINDETPAPKAAVDETRASWWQRLFGETAWLQQGAFATALVILSVAATTLYFKWQTAPSKETTVVYTQTPTPTPAPTATVQPTPDVKPIAPDAPAVNALQQATKAQPAAPKKLTEEQVIQNQMARAEREYQQAIKLLDRVIARKRNELTPALWQQYTASLALIDQSIAESRRAMNGEANAAASGQFLLAAYAKKLDLMRDIAMQAGQ